MLLKRIACTSPRQRGVALVLVGSSFAIQMVPPVLQRWAQVMHTSETVAMAVIAGVYLAITAVAMRRRVQ
jgi:hypothetical protein